MTPLTFICAACRRERARYDGPVVSLADGRRICPECVWKGIQARRSCR